MAIDKWGVNKRDAVVRLRPVTEITKGVRILIGIKYKEEDMYPRQQRIDNLFRALGNRGWHVFNNCQHEIHRCILRRRGWTEGEWSLVLGFSLFSLSFTRPESIRWWQEVTKKFLPIKELFMKIFLLVIILVYLALLF